MLPSSGPVTRAGALAGAALLAGTLWAPQAASAADKFKFPTGRISYKVSGGMMNGTNTITWAQNGQRLRQDMKGTVNLPAGAGAPPGAPAGAGGGAPRSMSMETWTISDGTYAYVHGPMSGNTVMKMKLPKDAKGGPGMNLLGAAKSQGKVVGKGTVLGKPCEIRESPAGKVWIWEGLPLKVDMTAGGGMTMEATKVETAYNPPATAFKVPAGMTVQERQTPTRGPDGKFRIQGGPGAPAAPGVPGKK